MSVVLSSETYFLRGSFVQHDSFVKLSCLLVYCMMRCVFLRTHTISIKNKKNRKIKNKKVKHTISSVYSIVKIQVEGFHELTQEGCLQFINRCFCFLSLKTVRKRNIWQLGCSQMLAGAFFCRKYNKINGNLTWWTGWVCYENGQVKAKYSHFPGEGSTCIFQEITWPGKWGGLQ